MRKEKGVSILDNKSVKLFPCDCMADGLVATVEKDDLDGQIAEPYINIAFWNQTMKFNGDYLSWRDRIRIIWHLLFKGNLPYTDMVMFRIKTAREFARYILSITKEQ